MSRYKSAIIWRYRESMSILDESIDWFLKEALKGYKKIFAQKKYNETMILWMLRKGKQSIQ